MDSGNPTSTFHLPVCGINLYAFCGNNPVNYADPWGTFWGMGPAASCAVLGGFGGGLYSVVNQFANTGGVNWGKVGVDAGSDAVGGWIAGSVICADPLSATGGAVVGQLIVGTTVGAAVDGVLTQPGDIPNPDANPMPQGPPHHYPYVPMPDPFTSPSHAPAGPDGAPTAGPTWGPPDTGPNWPFGVPMGWPFTNPWPADPNRMPDCPSGTK